MKFSVGQWDIEMGLKTGGGSRIRHVLSQAARILLTFLSRSSERTSMFTLSAPFETVAKGRKDPCGHAGLWYSTECANLEN